MRPHSIDRLIAATALSLRRPGARSRVLAHAPHTAADLLVEEWDRPYTREQAAYPSDYLRNGKYWAPVSRINNAYGDRNIVCECPPLEAYVD